MPAPDLPTPACPPRLGSRELFPTLAPAVYLNHAAISPPSAPVSAAVRAWLDDVAARGVGAFPDWVEQRERLRGRLARFLGAEGPETIALVAGTTRGIIDVAFSLPWEVGQRVLLFEGEFPSNVTPWIQAARGFGLEPRLLEIEGFGDGSGLGLERLVEELRRGVRLVAVSAVQFQTGLRMPLGEIGRLCHAHGAELFVDGIQAVGASPLDLSEVDYLVAGGHKWLMGVEGAGLVYVAPDALKRLVPRMAGWLGHEEGLRFLFEGPGHLKVNRPFKQDASVLEPGVSSAAGFAGLEASLSLLEELGLEAIHDHLQAYHDALEPQLQELGWRSLRAQDPAARSGTLSFLPPEGVDVVGVPERLAERGVAVTIPDGCLRLSPHWPNALNEVPQVVAALGESS